MNEAELHETIGRIDANVSLLVSRADKLDTRVGAVEKKLWVALTAFVVSGALLIPAKWHGLLAAFAI